MNILGFIFGMCRSNALTKLSWTADKEWRLDGGSELLTVKKVRYETLHRASELGTLTVFGKHSNELSGSIKGEEFLD
jgi:hypothetical protein